MATDQQVTIVHATFCDECKVESGPCRIQTVQGDPEQVHISRVLKALQPWPIFECRACNDTGWIEGCMGRSSCPRGCNPPRRAKSEGLK